MLLEGIKLDCNNFEMNISSQNDVSDAKETLSDQ